MTVGQVSPVICKSTLREKWETYQPSLFPACTMNIYICHIKTEWTNPVPGGMNIYLNFSPVNINTGTIDVSLVQIRSVQSF